MTRVLNQTYYFKHYCKMTETGFNFDMTGHERLNNQELDEECMMLFHYHREREDSQRKQVTDKSYTI